MKTDLPDSAHEHETFFISKIDQGLGLNQRPRLTPDQHKLLQTPVHDLTSEQSDALTDLNDLAVAALRSAYESDTSLRFTEGMSGHDRRVLINEPMERWKEHNRGIYRASENVITGIVQNWYLEGGRQQERKAAKSILPGCLGVLGLLILAAAVTFRTARR